ncbi:hypothetical protein GCM10020358_21390 [Amorphoplanes nipponensis]|uniref:Uncharacterized protein n=1 Tax=Actinoplanes nipponensis TaxID=135950 RepID=A0A919MU45_9ACTN|nr:hypothetical protein [Actinoplanes nipponensis]GIE54273.1 hypothetical protein Ani05nite_78070 [Actinoplanes nipponensis]
MRPELKCVVDPSRPCGACLAPGPRQCPYPYLLDPDEFAALVAAARVVAAREAARGDGTSGPAARAGSPGA